MSYHIAELKLTNSFRIMDGDTLVGWFNQSGNDTDEGLANAKLFAAAPELLAACQKAMAWFDGNQSDSAAEYDALQAAIAKAQCRR